MNKPEFDFDAFFNRYTNNLLNKNRERNAEFRFVQRKDYAQANIEELTIEQVIAKAISKFETENLDKRVIVRSDAKLFLIINYSSMVYYPLLDAKDPDKNDLKRQIFKEVQKILNVAQDMAKEITAHKILQAGNEIWDSLKTLGKSSW